ncbi:MAG: anti-sigma factor [Actinomycetota bacterium]|nr:anti-sigma factor [Actinomycetota bacterium]
MTTCDRMREDLIAYAAGWLDPSAAERVDQHTASCTDCRHELERIRETAALVSGAPLDHTPPADLIDRSIVRAGIAQQPPAATGWQRVASVAAPALGVAAVALAAIGVYWHGQENHLAGRIRTIHDAAGPTGVKLMSLHFAGSTTSGVADGDLWHMPHDNYRLVIHAHGLPITPPGFHYEVWMSGADGRRAMAGSFRVLSDTQTVFPLFVGVDPAEYPHVEIRLEREDGDPALTGSTVMQADLGP